MTLHGGVRLLLSGIMPAVVRDSSWDTVITVGAPQLVRLALDARGLVGCWCTAKTAETAKMDMSDKEISRSAFFLALNRGLRACGDGANSKDLFCKLGSQPRALGAKPEQTRIWTRRGRTRLGLVREFFGKN